jgi:hypothetical protein
MLMDIAETPFDLRIVLLGCLAVTLPDQEEKSLEAGGDDFGGHGAISGELEIDDLEELPHGAPQVLALDGMIERRTGAQIGPNADNLLPGVHIEVLLVGEARRVDHDVEK